MERGHSFVNDAEAGIGLICRHARVRAANLDSPAAAHRDVNQIVHTDCLVDRQQVMESIVPRGADAQPKIDLRERSNGHSHAKNDCKVSSTDRAPYRSVRGTAHSTLVAFKGKNLMPMNLVLGGHSRGAPAVRSLVPPGWRKPAQSCTCCSHR